MPKKKSTRGGPRPGSGRKPINPEGPGVAISAKVPRSLIAALEAIAKKRGMTRGQAITEAIRRFVS